MGAFLFVISSILLLQYSLTFGLYFSPSNWEPIQCIVEKLATAPFDNDTHQNKLKHHLDTV